MFGPYSLGTRLVIWIAQRILDDQVFRRRMRQFNAGYGFLFGPFLYGNWVRKGRQL